jgi:hypothetical protein
MRSADPPVRPARELRRLRNDVLLVLAIKVVAIVLLGWMFFGPSHRPDIAPQAIFEPVTPAPTPR